MSNIEQWLHAVEQIEQLEDKFERGVLLYTANCQYGPCPQELKPRLVAAMEKKANG